MVAPVVVAHRIEIAMKSVGLMLCDLPEIAEEWPQLRSGEQASLSLDWDHLIASYLSELDEHYRSGNMTTEEQARYGSLLQKLNDAIPIIERLDFMRPTVSLQTLKSA